MATNKPNIKQKTTWIGASAIGFSLFNIFSGGDIESAITGLTAGLGLLFSSDNK